MSRTKHAAELCVLLVEEVYGELPSRVFAVLLRRGRLPIPLLIQHTRITPKHLRHGLAVLVQQNLVYHYCDPDSNKTTYYEANPDAAYSLVRSGKVLRIIKSRYGSLAEDVIQNLLLLGHTRVGDLQDAYSSKAPPKPQVNGHTNGDNTNGVIGEKDQKPTQSQLNFAMCQLLEAGFIEPVTEGMFRSPADTYNLVEKEILQTKFGGGTKGVKQKEELKSSIRSRLSDLRDQGKDWRSYCTGYKSLSNGRSQNGMDKRRKLDNGAGGNGMDVVTLDPELVVRVSYDKCAVALRTQDLAEFVKKRVGATTSLVYRELLRALEDRIPRCRLNPDVDDPDEVQDPPTISTMELSTLLDPSIDVSTGIGKISGDKIDTSAIERNQTSRKRKADEAEVVGDASSDEDEDGENGDGMDIEHDGDYGNASKRANGTKVTFQDKPVTAEDRQNRMNMIKQHLMLLSEDKRGFIKRCGTQGMGMYTVEFEGLIDRLREEELDTIITQRFGDTGSRLSRILREKGKLDEKQMLTFGLVKQKDIRTKMTEMHMAGFADIQEIPRDASRTPGRTIFLWFFDTDRVTQLVLDSIYKAMSRAFQVLDNDRKNEADVIALSERSDVKREGEDMLPAELLNRLTNVREREQKLLGQIARLDTLIGVFRDY